MRQTIEREIMKTSKTINSREARKPLTDASHEYRCINLDKLLSTQTLDHLPHEREIIFRGFTKLCVSQLTSIAFIAEWGTQ